MLFSFFRRAAATERRSRRKFFRKAKRFFGDKNGHKIFYEKFFVKRGKEKKFLRGLQSRKRKGGSLRTTRGGIGNFSANRKYRQSGNRRARPEKANGRKTLPLASLAQKMVLKELYREKANGRKTLPFGGSGEKKALKELYRSKANAAGGGRRPARGRVRGKESLRVKNEPGRMPDPLILNRIKFFNRIKFLSDLVKRIGRSAARPFFGIFPSEPAERAFCGGSFFRKRAKK